ncbi:DUF2963 domain-containing protein [Candidatus Phytoplasma meliae]|uniref:DUF2963 domain-containing protein n=1 Tax=Candidatus Phytoplasma meliae TaxID=1848402 RepID=A0ABS5CXY9_9MOLU|nr:hypothetical protein [Candidatus Phytoplasma meliae]MBP5835840.1 hypothetical protein [Candidatus Phytoplasma meliae]
MTNEPKIEYNQKNQKTKEIYYNLHDDKVFFIREYNPKNNEVTRKTVYFLPNIITIEVRDKTATTSVKYTYDIQKNQLGEIYKANFKTRDESIKSTNFTKSQIETAKKFCEHALQQYEFYNSNNNKPLKTN